MTLLLMACGILAGLAWEFLTLLAVGAALLQYFLPPSTNWLNIHEYCNILNYFFTMIAFSLAVRVLEKSGRNPFYFKHASIGLAILIFVVLQVLAAFNMENLPPPPDLKREYEKMEGGTDNEEPVPLPGKSKISIAWEILHRLFGAELMAYKYYPQSQ